MKNGLNAEVVRREKGAYRHYTVVSVPSTSRPGVFHWVDVTNGRCSCIGWIKNFPRKPCKHLRALGVKL